MTDPLHPRLPRPRPPIPGDPIDPIDPIGPAPRPPRPGLPPIPGLPHPGLPPIPWTPFGPGDNHAPDPQGVVDHAAKVRRGLEKAQTELTGARHGPGPDGTPPVVVETTRADGLWPWLLIRQQAGDIGTRPLDPTAINAILHYQAFSPDIVITAAGPAAEPAEIGRDGIQGLLARARSEIHPGFSYDAWVHVWNLGRSPASGIRVRVFLGPTNRFLGGRQLDLGDRIAVDSHRIVKAATFTAGLPGDNAIGMLTAVAECLSDPAESDRNPGMDRHCAHRQIYTSGI